MTMSAVLQQNRTGACVVCVACKCECSVCAVCVPCKVCACVCKHECHTKLTLKVHKQALPEVISM